MRTDRPAKELLAELAREGAGNRQVVRACQALERIAYWEEARKWARWVAGGTGGGGVIYLLMKTLWGK